MQTRYPSILRKSVDKVDRWWCQVRTVAIAKYTHNEGHERVYTVMMGGGAGVLFRAEAYRRSSGACFERSASTVEQVTRRVRREAVWQLYMNITRHDNKKDLRNKSAYITSRCLAWPGSKYLQLHWQQHTRYVCQKDRNSKDHFRRSGGGARATAQPRPYIDSRG